MRSKLVALLFSDLSITASHSRPRVSNDNPFSESQFRTLKYRPEFPDRFGSLEHARGVSRDLFAWYNNAHHHSGLSYLTPADVHYGRAATVLAVRHRTSSGRVRRPSRAVRPGGTTARNAPNSRLDQIRLLDRVVRKPDGSATYRLDPPYKWTEMAAKHFSLLTERVELVDHRHIEDKLIEARERAVKAGHAKKNPDVGKAT